MPESLTKTGRPRGRLLKLSQLAQIANYSDRTLRNRWLAGECPALFTRPGSPVLVGFEGEFADWLESNRQPQQAA
jgi:hypothetical protein